MSFKSTLFDRKAPRSPPLFPTHITTTNDLDNYISTATNEAILILQSQVRRLLATIHTTTLRSQHLQKPSTTLTLHSNTPIPTHLTSNLIDLQYNINIVAHLSHQLPYLYPTTPSTTIELNQLLHYTPGYTLHPFSSFHHQDATQDRLRNVVVAALQSGLTLVIDIHNNNNNTQTKQSLLDLCHPHYFPIELITNPLAIFQPNIYGPLIGLQQNDTTRHLLTLGITQEDDDKNNKDKLNYKQIKKNYHNLLRTTHPDRGGTLELFQSIQTAYHALTVTHSNPNNHQNTDFLPNKNFKIILYNNHSSSPPKDLLPYIQSIFINNTSSNILQPTHTIGNTINKFQHYQGYIGEYESKIEQKRVATELYNNKLLSNDNRTYVENQKEYQHRLFTIQTLLLTTKHQLRSDLFALAWTHSPLDITCIDLHANIAIWNQAQELSNIEIYRTLQNKKKEQKAALKIGVLDQEIQLLIEQEKKATKTLKSKQDRFPKRLLKLEKLQQATLAKQEEAKKDVDLLPSAVKFENDLLKATVSFLKLLFSLNSN